jgi:hypothetical protein
MYVWIYLPYEMLARTRSIMYFLPFVCVLIFGLISIDGVEYGSTVCFSFPSFFTHVLFVEPEQFK